MKFNKSNIVVWSLIGAFGVFSYVDAKAKDRANIAEFGLDQSGVELMSQCKSVFDSHRLVFKNGTPVSRGCACIAKQVATNLESQNVKSAVSALNMVVEHVSRSKDVTANPDMLRARLVSAATADPALGEQIPVMFEALAQCG